MITWEGISSEEALKLWDAGESVWSCEQGGVGPGYEQVIQLMGFEMLRAMLSEEINWQRAGEDREYWREVRSKINAVPAVKAEIERLGPSGAQHGAAMNLASIFCRNGYTGGMEMVPKHRRIQVRKSFPGAMQR